MHTNTVIVNCDIHMTYSGDYPVYRLFVGDELFTERTWIWTSEFLREQIVLEAPYGVYAIRYELRPHANAQLEVQNPTIVSGSARFRKHLRVEIHDENK